MSRKSQTVATFAVRLLVPTGLNVNDVAEYIRESLRMHGAAVEKENVLFDGVQATVSITKKETTYGQ